MGQYGSISYESKSYYRIRLKVEYIIKENQTIKWKEITPLTVKKVTDKRIRVVEIIKNLNR